MSNLPLLSIIISTKDKLAEVLWPTLLSLKQQNFADYEVIIVDQNNDQRTLALGNEARELEEKIFYYAANTVGLSKGRNYGYTKARGSWLLFFDDDAMMGEKVLEKIALILKQEINSKRIYYGRILNLEDKKNYLSRASCRVRLNLFSFDGACSIGLLFNRQVLEQVGLFDEDFGVGAKFGAGEESDLILRALECNIPVWYLPQFVVYHPKAKMEMAKGRAYGKGVGALYRKHLFISINNFVILGCKLLFELAGRLFLSLFYLLVDQRPKAKFHLTYLRGFFIGFLYENFTSK